MRYVISAETRCQGEFGSGFCVAAVSQRRRPGFLKLYVPNLAGGCAAPTRACDARGRDGLGCETPKDVSAAVMAGLKVAVGNSKALGLLKAGATGHDLRLMPAVEVVPSERRSVAVRFKGPIPDAGRREKEYSGRAECCTIWRRRTRRLILQQE